MDVVLWGSLPCTGGYTWNYINGKTPEGKARIEEHTKLMVELLECFVRAGKYVLKQGGIICFEWPRQRAYWKRKDIIDMQTVLKLNPTTFCGCAVGLKSCTPGKEHLFIKKPWRVCCSHDCIDKIFSKFQCPGVSRIHEHDQCRGTNAKNSERYTDVFAVSAHRAFRSAFENM